MSDKAEKKAEPAAEKKEPAKGAAKGDAAAAAPAPEAAAKTGGGGIAGLMTKLPVLIGGVMIVEALVLFVGFRIVFGSPKSAAADLTDVKKEVLDGDKDKGGDQGASVEIALLDSKFPNKLSGRTFLYDVSISVQVKGNFADKVKKEIGDHDALIKDRVRTIIAQLDPEKLGGGSEPGLETLRRQVKYQLDEILGDGMIDEVLVPKCLSYRTDY